MYGEAIASPYMGYKKRQNPYDGVFPNLIKKE
jgi:hypothetical protein